MKKKILAISALFALMAFGFVFAAVPSEAAQVEVQPDIYSAENPYTVTPMLTCTRFCSACLKFGRNGACTLAGLCC